MCGAANIVSAQEPRTHRAQKGSELPKKKQPEVTRIVFSLE